MIHTLNSLQQTFHKSALQTWFFVKIAVSWQQFSNRNLLWETENYSELTQVLTLTFISNATLMSELYDIYIVTTWEKITANMKSLFY